MLFKLIPLVFFLSFVLVPFFQNYIPHTWAYVVWGISALYFVIDSIKDTIDRKKSKNQNGTFEIMSRGCDIVILVFFSGAFVANYLDTAYSWKWVGVVTLAIAVSVGLRNWMKWVEVQDQYSFIKKRKIKHNICKILIFYLLADVFWVALILESIVFQFLAGGACMIIIFVNLAEVILSGQEFNIWLVLHDFVAGVALTVFLIYIIPDATLRNIVLTIAAALYGGILTLVGVAWTIKDGQDRETETKRLGCMPFLQLELSNDNGSSGLYMDLPLAKDKFTNTVYQKIRIKNVGNGTAANITYNWTYTVNSVSVNDYPPINAIMQGDSYYIHLTCDADDTILKNATAILTLRYSDLLGHDYEQKIVMNFENYDLVRIENDTPQYIGDVCYLAAKRSNYS